MTPQDRYGRDPGDPFYGSDRNAEDAAQNRVVADLARRIARLEKAMRRKGPAASIVSALDLHAADIATNAAAIAANIGNVHIIGGHGVDGPSSTWASSSTSYVEIGGTDQTLGSFTKDYDDTDLIVLFWMDGFASTATIRVDRAVSLNASNYGGWPWRINQLSTHTPISGFVAIAGIAAATYDVRLKVKIGSGSGSLNVNNEDRLGYLLLEAPGALSFG